MSSLSVFSKYIQFLLVCLVCLVCLSAANASAIERESARVHDVSSLNKVVRLARVSAGQVGKVPAKAVRQTSGKVGEKVSSKSEVLRQALGLSDNNSLLIKRAHSDKKGNTHTRYIQQYKGLPVWGEQITLHENANGGVQANGFITKGLDQASVAAIANTKASLTIAQAIAIAKESEGHNGVAWKTKNINSDLAIYINEHSVAIKAYVVDYFAEPDFSTQNIPVLIAKKVDPTRPFFIIDSETGEVLKKWDGLTHLKIGTGPGGNLKTGRYEYGADFGYLDVQQSGSTCIMDNQYVRTENLNHGESAVSAHSFECPSNTVEEINGAYSPLNDAHYFGGVIYDMYQDWLGVPPLTFQLVMRVHYGHNYENAFWDGHSMTFGDGGSFLYPLVDINISAHEVSHGFTEQNSNLIYDGQSGGINEAFSDISGEAAEYYWRGTVDWFSGGDIMKSEDGFRYFADPTRDGVSIGHADDYHDGLDVHYSSGVYNRAFYLLSNKPGWTVQTAFEVFAYANMNYWGPSESFDTGACGVLESAHSLGYSSIDVDSAFQTVGVNCGYMPFIDVDLDGMDDSWELSFSLDPSDPTDGEGDLDVDGLTNLLEYTLGSFPNNLDSDSDTLSDFDEYSVYGTSPATPDSDGDVMDDAYELSHGFDPLDGADGQLDADGDSFSNTDEYLEGTDPNDGDSKPEVSIHSFEGGMPAGWMVPESANAGWAIDEGEAQHGTHSLRAEVITHSQVAQIEFTAEFSQSSLSFWAKTSTESCCDYLSVYVDGSSVAFQRGEVDWTEHQITITEGAHTIRFEYSKDGSVNTGSDTVWIDNLRYILPNPDVDNDGILNSWEDDNGLDRNDSSDAVLDNDGDLLSNLGEFNNDTNPNIQDTDGDGLTDGQEVNELGTDPLIIDTDADGVSDLVDRFPIDAAAFIDADGDSKPDHWNAKCDAVCQVNSGLTLDVSLMDFDNDGLIDRLDDDNGVDSFPPTLLVPADISTVAQGLTTTVNLGVASAVDLIDGVIKNIENNSPIAFSPGRHFVEWSARDSAGNLAQAFQKVAIIPLASFESTSQVSDEGVLVTLKVVLNGVSPQYPVRLPYNVSGSASYPEDHNLKGGVLIINADAKTMDSGEIQFMVDDSDGLSGEINETVVIELVADNSFGEIANAALGGNKYHTVTIVEPNRPPDFSFEVLQADIETKEINTSLGIITINSDVYDPNPEDTHVFVWSLNGEVMGDMTSSTIELDPSMLVSGENKVTLLVSDNGLPSFSQEQTMTLNVTSSDSGGGGAANLLDMLLLLIGVWSQRVFIERKNMLLKVA